MCLQVSQGTSEDLHREGKKMFLQKLLAERLCHRRCASHVMREAAFWYRDPTIDNFSSNLLGYPSGKVNSLRLNPRYHRRYYRFER